jgi:hypothetical protein
VNGYENSFHHIGRYLLPAVGRVGVNAHRIKLSSARDAIARSFFRVECVEKFVSLVDLGGPGCKKEW